MLLALAVGVALSLRFSGSLARDIVPPLDCFTWVMNEDSEGVDCSYLCFAFEVVGTGDSYSLLF